jgi:guanylate kinase
MSSRGTLIVLSGPSGSGKSTLIDRLLKASPLPLEICPSVTTRSPRADDQHAKRYIHVSAGEFQEALESGKLLEWAEVSGHWYGTPREPVEAAIKRGHSILLEIDVQGGMAIRNIFPECVLIFLKASSVEEYERRLRRRGTNSEQEIERRLAAARRELEMATHYNFQVVNDDLDRAVHDIQEILKDLGGKTRA